MKNARILLQLAAILVSLALVALVVWIAFAPMREPLLAWAGLLAGLLALVHAGRFEQLPAGVRAVMAIGGLAVMVWMSLLIL